MKHGALDLTDKHRVIAMGDLADQLTLDSTEGVVEDRKAQFADREGGCVKPTPDTLLGFEENSS